MLTRTGTAMTCAAVSLVALGVWADYPEVVVLGLAAATTVLLAALWLVASPQLTVVREVRPHRVFEGTAAQSTLTVTNVGRRGSSPLVVTETVAGHRTMVTLPALVAGESRTVAYDLPVTRRGRYVIPHVLLGRSDPLRLLQRGHPCGAESIVHVYPRVHLLAMKVVGGPHDAEGPTSSSAPLGGAAFHSLREYVPGDDWRRIHWASTARTGTVMTRHLVLPDEPRELVVLDTSAAPYTGALFEDAVRVAASFCVSAENARLPFQLRTTTAARRESATTALEFLTKAKPDLAAPGLTGLGDLLRDAVTGTQGIALTVITGDVDDEVVGLLTRLRPRFLTISLACLSTKDLGTRPRGVLTITAPNSDRFATAWNRLVLR